MQSKSVGRAARSGVWCGVLLPGAIAIALAVGIMELVAAAGGPLSHHMGMHIILMNVLAPAAAFLTCDAAVARFPLLTRGRWLVVATSAQIAALWIAHAPAILAWSTSSDLASALTQLGLFASATWFWLAVLAQRGSRQWRALVALLLTGKLFCLLAALLVFALRALYVLGPSDLHLHHAASLSLSDQQLAGLLMVVICPLTYVVAAIVISARMLRDLAASDLAPLGPSRNPR